MFDVVKKYSAHVVSCGVSFQLPLGTMIGSLLAFPLLGLEQMLAYFSATLAFWFLFVVALVSLVSLYVVTLTYDEIPLVIDKVLGLAIFCKGQGWAIKLMMVSFVFFHVLRGLFPFLVKKIVGHSISFGTFLDILWPSITAGIAGNVLMRFMMWVGH